jgi:hypothetical protein
VSRRPVPDRKRRSGAEPRLIDLTFEAHARLQAVGREEGTGSDDYAAILDELRQLRQLRDDERVVRRP